MTTSVDSAITLKKESVFGTDVTPDVSYPFTDADLQWMPTFADGTTRYGTRLRSASQRVLVKEEVGGSFTTEATNKGLGKLFEAALGVGTSTQIDDSDAYQQVFSPLINDYLPSYTIQMGVAPVGGGNSQPHTFGGMVCSGFELTADNGAIPTLKWNWVGRSFTKDTAFVTPSYPAGLLPFSFIHGSIESGTITTPTATALAEGTASIGNVRSISLSYNNGLDSEGFNFGAAGKRSRKPVVAVRELTGTMVVEYSDNTLRDAHLNQDDVGIILTFELPTAIDDGNKPTLQFCIPVSRLEGETPKPALGGPTTMSMGFTVLDGGSATHPFYVAIVTAETAI